MPHAGKRENGTEPQNHACSIVSKSNAVLLVGFIFRIITWSIHIPIALKFLIKT